MYSAPVEPWPHQEIVSRRLVESWPYSYMMCDEVGLGKTIEAALAIRSLVLSGRAKRVAIVAPASLTDQWHRELAQKAMLPFYKSKPKPGASGKIQHTRIYPNETEVLDSDLYSPELNIISSGLVSRKERADTLMALMLSLSMRHTTLVARIRAMEQPAPPNMDNSIKLCKMACGLKQRVCGWRQPHRCKLIR